MFTDMTLDPDILEETRGSKVRLLWSLDDLVARLADLPEGDQVQNSWASGASPGRWGR